MPRCIYGCCTFSVESACEFEKAEEQSLLDSRIMNRRTRTYGTKKSKFASTAATRIFGSTANKSPESSPNATPSPIVPSDAIPGLDINKKVDTVATNLLKDENDSDSDSSSNDLAQLISQLEVGDENDETEAAHGSINENSASAESSDAQNSISDIDSHNGDAASVCSDLIVVHQPDLEVELRSDPNSSPTSIDLSALHFEYTASSIPALQPLVEASEKDKGLQLGFTQWKDALPPNSKVKKIAEASYGEVYHIKNKIGNSILKIMQLRYPEDPESQTSQSAMDVRLVVSELRIMNLLAEMPGFVRFKAAHLIFGQPPAEIQKAWTKFVKDSDDDFESLFTDPSNFTKTSMFLVIELGDAGDVLDSVELDKIEQVWDVFIGTVLALGRAEVNHQFEHRDLHENNICVSLTEEPKQVPTKPGRRRGRKAALPKETPKAIESNPNLRYGRSGLEVTILDYGLSRATLTNGEVAFSDLEADLVVFHGTSRGKGAFQFDTYRYMRVFLLTEKKFKTSKAWHDRKSRKANNGKGWDEFIPYTNVLWIRYILHSLIGRFVGEGEELKGFKKEIKELESRLEPKCDEGFGSAEEVCEYLYASGWVE